jgi:hypothetical protein
VRKLLIAASFAAIAIPGAALAQVGHYDSYGVWHPDYGRDVAYAGAGALAAREDAIGRRIDDGQADGLISGSQASYDRDQLGRIRDMQADMVADHDGLTLGDHDRLAAWLDNLDSTIHAQAGD